MDKPRESTRKKRRPYYIGGSVLGVIVLSAGIAQLKPAAPTVEGASIWTDTVRRGPMVREVRGVGTLTPENIRIIPARTAGRVEQIFARAGTAVEPGTLLLTLSNPDLQLQLMQAERELRTAQSELVNLRSNLRMQILNQEGIIAQVQTQFNDAQRQNRTNEELLAKQLIARNDAEAAKDQLTELRTRLDIEKKRLEQLNATVETQLAAQQAQIDQLTAMVAHRRTDLASLEVRSGSGGVLQRLDLEAGQWVNPGTELARVVEPGRLKAVLRIGESQMRDVVIGQRAIIDTRNDTIVGRVVRIDPAADQGTIGVDVAFEGELPTSARPDISVDGRIELERLDDVLFVGRPSIGNSGQRIGMWVVSSDGKEAERVQVQLGAMSVNHVQIAQGLSQGDVVILSPLDASIDSHDRIRIR